MTLQPKGIRYKIDKSDNSIWNNPDADFCQLNWLSLFSENFQEIG